MISDKILPAHILKMYVWEVLKRNTSMTQIPITVVRPDNSQVIVNVDPIVPEEDEPKFDGKKEPYIVYGYVEDFSRPYPERSGNFSMRVTAETFAELGHILNVISRAFEREDITAAEINEWTSRAAPVDLIGIKFTHVKTTYVEGGTPPETQGGRIEGLVNVSYRYITHQEVLTYKNGAWS